MGTDIAIPSPFLKEIGLNPEKIESEQRPLTISEVRTILAKISEPQRTQYLDELEKEIPPIPADYSIYGIRPRSFSTAQIDQIGVPEDFSFSASSIKNYIDCPRKFFFQNILRIQDPLSMQRSYFQMGHAVHDLFEKLHHPESIWSKGKLPDEDDLKALFEEFSKPHLEPIEFFERHSMSEKIFQALPDYINAIYSLEQVPPRSTIGVEHKFRFDFRGFRFSGRFDRLVQLNNGVAVVDYKTTESNKSSQKVYDLAFPQEGMPMEIQLPLYLLACKAGGNPFATAILLYTMKDPYKKKYKGFEGGHLKAAALNLGTGPTWGNPVSEADFATFEDRLEKILKKIMEDRIFDCVPTDHPEARTCLHSVNNKPGCDFLPFCEERLEALKKGKEQ